MATYAIGDIQGCYDELRALLDRLQFDPEKDRLWFTGDLVNRGPKSLETLRFVRDLGDSAITVLGNHDLHLLALWAGHGRPDDEDDSLHQVLDAPDSDTLMQWLLHRPLIHRDRELGWNMIHAGLPPQWDLATASERAHEVEAVLRSNRYRDFFRHMYGNRPKRWSPRLDRWERLRYITNCLTRLRYLKPDGSLALKEKGPPGSQKPGLVPWFEHPMRASRGERILFGHWSTLGFLLAEDFCALDTGCLWGGRLTALRLDGETKRIDQPCQGALRNL